MWRPRISVISYFCTASERFKIPSTTIRSISLSYCLLICQTHTCRHTHNKINVQDVNERPFLLCAILLLKRPFNLFYCSIDVYAKWLREWKRKKIMILYFVFHQIFDSIFHIIHARMFPLFAHFGLILQCYPCTQLRRTQRQYEYCLQDWRKKQGIKR